MLLAIDVGNTQTTIGLFSESGDLTRQWRMQTDTASTIDELQMKLYTYFLMLDEKLGSIEDVAVASVVPIVTQKWQIIIDRMFNKQAFVISSTNDCGIEIDMPYPTQAGADRITNAVAAKQTYGIPVLVVDFGTATTIDVVDDKGAFRGGAIMPGFMLSAQTLFSKAAKLSSVPLVCPEHALGSTTQEAVQSGMVIGAAAQIEGLVARIKKELNCPDAKVVATGGNSTTVAKATDIFDAIDPDLTLRGIYQIWKQFN